jgi:hypothetical protein
MVTIQTAKDTLDPILNNPIYELNPDFWEEIRHPYMQHMLDLSDHCHRILSGIFVEKLINIL